MKAKVIKPFYDKKEGVTRNVGDTFTVSEDRFEEINSTKFGELVSEVAEASEAVEAVAEETAKPKKKPAKKPARKG
jgi:hypothetical protein